MLCIFKQGWWKLEERNKERESDYRDAVKSLCSKSLSGTRREDEQARQSRICMFWHDEVD
jgi:hypothetical protein